MMQRAVILLLFVVALVASVYGAPKALNHGLSTTFTQTDVASFKTFLQTRDTKDIHEAYFVTQALSLLGTREPLESKTKDLCALVSKTLSDKSVTEKLDARSIYHATGVAQVLNCDIALDKAVTDAIKSVIGEGATVSNYYYAVSAAYSLRDKTKKDVSDNALAAIIEKLGDLTESDGAVRSSKDDKEGNLYNTALTHQIYARILAGQQVSEQDNEHIDEMVSKVETILDLANEGENSLYFTSASDDTSHSNLAVTAELARGFASLGKSLKKSLDVTPIQLAHLGEYFLSHKNPSTAEDAYYVLVGLRAVQQSEKAPLALTVERSSILATAKGTDGDVKLRLADIFDYPIVGKVTLVKSHALGKPDVPLLTNQEVKDNVLAFLAVKPEQGFYVLEFRAVPADTKKYATIDSATRRVKIVGSIAITDLELFVSDSREARADGGSYKAEHPKAIEESIQAGLSQHIHVQFKIRNSGGSTSRPLTVQQAFVRFVHTKTGHETSFVAIPNDATKAYKAIVSLDDVAKSQFRSFSGDYTISVVVGDAFVQNPISWTIAKNVHIQFPASRTDAHIPASLAAKPEIAHKFRVPEKRPPALVSTIFTGLAFAPVLVLLSGFASLGANIRRFPTDADFVPAVAFVAMIGLNLALIALYWLALNLVQTLTYLAILAVPTIFFGNRALSSLARKEKQQ